MDSLSEEIFLSTFAFVFFMSVRVLFATRVQREKSSITVRVLVQAATRVKRSEKLAHGNYRINWIHLLPTRLGPYKTITSHYKNQTNS
jgi:hypothetical protein